MDTNSNVNDITHEKFNNKLCPMMIPQFIKSQSVQFVLKRPNYKLSKTKKICTLGPKISTVQSLLNLIDLGMNVARLNFSHGTHESHAKFVQTIRQANKLRPGRQLAILLDTKGPQIRTGKNQDGKQIILVKGQQLQISTDYSYLSNSKRISCSYSGIIESVQIGSTVLFSDGKISSVVKRVDKEKNIVVVQILNNGTLGQKKNMCLPGSIVNLPTINSYDENDIVNFGLIHKVDFIAISFARYGKDIEYVRKILAQKDEQFSKRVRIISKIQNHQALQNLNQIVEASDGVMIARGDLGMETPLQKIIVLQKIITATCLRQNKFVIVATQMLQSMQSKPRPTRAEVSDITNAVLDVADCTMTSGQTANGQFPLQTVQYMNQISLQTQRVCDYQRIFNNRSHDLETTTQAFKIVELSLQKQADLIFLKTEDLQLINKVSSYRPEAYIFGFSEMQNQMRMLTCLNYGVYVFDSSFFTKPDQLLLKIKKNFGLKSTTNIVSAQLNGKFFSCHCRAVSLNQQN